MRMMCWRRSGPSTMAAMLSSLRMGFRTLQIQQKSEEIQRILEAAKKEFANFGKGLETTQKRLHDADDELEKLIAAGDLDKAFEVAHALKGMYGNISITPIFKPINEMTEMLRARKNVDYSPFIKEAKEQKQKLVDLYNER